MVKDHLPQLNNLGPTSVVIVIHPDEMAIRESLIITDHTEYIRQLRACLLAADRKQAAILVAALGKNCRTFPPFIADISQGYYFIDNRNSGTTEDQAHRIIDWLVEHNNIDHVVFTGGWKGACLNHAMNTILKGDKRIKDVIGLGLFETRLNHPNLHRKLSVEVYERLVF